MRFKINILFLFLFLFLFSFAKEPKKILAIHSYHKGFYWTDSITDGINSVFETNKNNENIEIDHEYLDLKRDPSKEYLESLREFYKIKNQNENYDGLIVSDNLALNFVINNREELFDNIPIVFCGINNYDGKVLRNKKKITGVIERVDYRGTLDLMIKLHPNAEKVLVILDSSFTGEEVKKDILKIIPEYENRFDFEILDVYTVPELEKKLKNLSENTLIYALLINRTSDENFISYSKGAQLLKQAKNPVYLGWEFYFEKGAVGGKMTSGFLQGETAAKMLLDILNGADINKMEISSKFTSEYKIDYNAVKKYSIEKSLLPEDALIINKPKSFFERNTIQMFLGIFTLLIFISVLVFKLRFNLKNKKEKHELNLKLERKIVQRTAELKEVNKKIMEQQSKLVEQAYDEGFSRVKSGIIHNIGNVTNSLYITMQEEINHRETDKEHEIRFFKNVVFDELIKDDISSEKRSKITIALPEILKAVNEKKNAELNRLKYCKKEIKHIKGIIKLQKNYLGTLGTESYFAMNELLKEVVEKRDFDYRINLELELYAVEKVLCDKTQIIQVFDNVIKNQIEDLLESEKIYKSLKITTSEDEKNVIVEIADNGDLYSENYVKNIFNLSFITKEKNRKNFELYGCYQIIKKYGGNITFKSEPRKGNVFMIYIPKN